jgi:hypothetical protein
MNVPKVFFRWILPSLFVLIGLSSIAGYLFSSRQGLGNLLYGAGFLLATPHLFFHPGRFNRTIPTQGLGTLVTWLAFVGVALVFLGLLLKLTSRSI